MYKIILLVLFVVCAGFGVSAGADEKRLSLRQIERLSKVKTLLQNVDTRSLQDSIKDLQQSTDPEGNLKVLEAMANTYADIVQEYEIQEQVKLKKLYSLIELNMAYFQLSGPKKDPNAQGWNSLIQRKLLQYLPADILTQPELFHSLGL